MGSYTIDSHNVQRYITPEGYVQNEGDIGVRISPYTIAYGSLVPKKSQCENLVVECLREQFAHCVWQYAHGARVHDSRSKCSDRRRVGTQ